MNWAGIDSALIEVIRTASGISDLDVYWVEQPQGWRSDVHVRLDPIAFVGQGRDETRQATVGTQVQQRVYGVRSLTVQVTCETQAQGLAGSAWALADDISTGLYREDTRDLLNNDAELGVATLGGVTQATYTDKHKRRRSAAVFPVTFNAQTTRMGRLIDFIGSVGYSGRILHPDDSETVITDTVTLP